MAYFCAIITPVRFAVYCVAFVAMKSCAATDVWLLKLRKKEPPTENLYYASLWDLQRQQQDVDGLTPPAQRGPLSEW